MACKKCNSVEQATCGAEIMIHPTSKLDRPTVPGIWVFPQLQTCLVCGYADFTIGSDEVRQIVAAQRPDPVAE